MSLSLLCQACGLCCSGALFRYVKLKADEPERMRGIGAEIVKRRDGSVAMRLGCRLLQGTRCGVYSQRPSTCAGFVCVLGNRVARGELEFEHALRTVERARELVDEVARALPPEAAQDPASTLERAHQFGLRDGPAPLRRAEAFLEEHFLGLVPAAAERGPPSES